jgi:hypothetical protein
LPCSEANNLSELADENGIICQGKFEFIISEMMNG